MPVTTILDFSFIKLPSVGVVCEAVGTEPADSSEQDVYALALGKIVFTLREQSREQQFDFAKRIRIPQSTLSRIERGQSRPDVFTLSRIAEGLGTTPATLFEQVDAVLARAEQTADSAIRPAQARGKKSDEWWEATVTTAGFIGLVALVTLAVALIIGATRRRA